MYESNCSSMMSEYDSNEDEPQIKSSVANPSGNLKLYKNLSINIHQNKKASLIAFEKQR